MIKSDYIILGAGASGLMLAYRMSQDSFYDDKSILVIDKIKDKGNDRTWCYWEDGKGEWDELLTKTWPNIYFGSDFYSETISIHPFNYKVIRSEDLYKALWERVNLKPNITFIEDTISSVTELEKGVQVIATKAHFFGAKVFNSLPNPKVYESQTLYPVLQQHFVGWFVKTETDCFDDSTAIFMDFKVAQKENTRFMYVLPFDKQTALFEYTLFSKELLEYEAYEQEIRAYLSEKNITNYEIIETEKGAIPMTCFKFHKRNSKHV